MIPIKQKITDFKSNIKNRLKEEFSKVGTYVKIMLFLVIVIIVITTSNKYITETVKREIVTYKDSVRYKDVARDKKIAEIDKTVNSMQELSIKRGKQFDSLQTLLNALQIDKKDAMKTIDKLSSNDLAKYFQGKAIKQNKK